MIQWIAEELWQFVELTEGMFRLGILGDLSARGQIYLAMPDWFVHWIHCAAGDHDVCEIVFGLPWW